jgi:DNA-directed RNA polymerase subunit M/transcription elongation factor TFIIS
MTKRVAMAVIIVSICIFAGMVSAQESVSFYQSLVEQAVPDQEALAHSEKALREHKDIKVLEKFVIPTFHKQSGDLETSPNTFCRNCHGPLPHRSQLRTRGFNNMHVRFIACETCHFRPKDVTLEYQWLNYENKQPVDGKGLFRLGQEIDNAKQRPFNPKIAPMYQGQPALVFKDQAFSKDIASQWEKADSKAKVLLRAKVHLPLEKKGPECQACHDEQKPMLNLQALGATAEQSQAMAKHIIPQFIRRYKKDDEHITIREMLR